MDAQAVAENLEKTGTETALKIAPAGDAVSDETFEHLVRQALDAVHGTMLFKMRLGNDDDGQHVAAAERHLEHRPDADAVRAQVVERPAQRPGGGQRLDAGDGGHATTVGTAPDVRVVADQNWRDRDLSP